MKTTLNVNDEILRQAKECAMREGITLTRLVEDSLRIRLMARTKELKPFKLRLLTVEGTRPPTVDIFDREALYDVLDRE